MGEGNRDSGFGIRDSGYGASAAGPYTDARCDAGILPVMYTDARIFIHGGVKPLGSLPKRDVDVLTESREDSRDAHYLIRMDTPL